MLILPRSAAVSSRPAAARAHNSKPFRKSPRCGWCFAHLPSRRGGGGCGPQKMLLLGSPLYALKAGRDAFRKPLATRSPLHRPKCFQSSDVLRPGCPNVAWRRIGRKFDKVSAERTRLRVPLAAPRRNLAPTAFNTRFDTPVPSSSARRRREHAPAPPERLRRREGAGRVCSPRSVKYSG